MSPGNSLKYSQPVGLGGQEAGRIGPEVTSFSAPPGPQFDDSAVVPPLSPCAVKKVATTTRQSCFFMSGGHISGGNIHVSENLTLYVDVLVVRIHVRLSEQITLYKLQ